MMLGLLAGAPWIVNPLIGSATVVLFCFLGKELYSEPVGRLAALFGLLSPFVLSMSSEFMNHVSAAALALPFFVYGASLLRAQFSRYKTPMLTFSIILLIFVCILLGFNYLTNGHPLLFGYQVLYGEKVLPGFGRGAWGDPHTPAQGVRQTLTNMIGLHKYLFEWPMPSLVFVAILFVSMKVNRWDILLLFSLLLLAVSYLFYWFQDWCFGPRFLYDAAGGVILLTVRGMQRLPYVLKNQLGRALSVRRICGLTVFVVLLSTSIGVVSNIPALVRVYSNSYWSVNGKVLKAVKQRGLQKAIVFTKSYYGSVVAANSPLLDKDVIYVRHLDPFDADFMKLFPGYRYYLAEDDRIVEIRPR